MWSQCEGSNSECGALFILMFLRRTKRMIRIFCEQNLHGAFHVTGCIKYYCWQEKINKHRYDEHSIKEVHAQASCFMYVDFVIIINSMFPIKEPQCIADALCCQRTLTLWLVKWRWTIQEKWKGRKKTAMGLTTRKNTAEQATCCKCDTVTQHNPNNRVLL